MVLPLGDDDSTRRTVPVVTYVLIALNVLVFLLELSAGDAFIQQWAFVPSRFSANPTAEAPTVITAMFMHGGWLHLGGNMLYLWIFGDNLEDALGHVRYLVFYLATGILAGLAHVAVTAALGANPLIPSLGASGAISGVLGGYIVLFPRRRVRVLWLYSVMEVPAIVAIGLWFVFQLVSGAGMLGGQMGGVAYGAHIGGFLAGVVLVKLFGGDRRPAFGRA
jgi:membrane associated rhomboid family serine protease